MAKQPTLASVIKRAWALKAEGRHSEGEDLLKAQAPAVNDNVKGLLSLAEAFRNVAHDYNALGYQGRLSRDYFNGQAFNCLERAAQLQPNDVDLALRVARVADQIQLTAAAYNHTRRALRMDNANVVAWTLLSKLLNRSGQQATAEICRRNAALIQSGQADAIDISAMEDMGRGSWGNPRLRGG